jgi:hypothetical protein
MSSHSTTTRARGRTGSGPRWSAGTAVRRRSPGRTGRRPRHGPCAASRRSRSRAWNGWGRDPVRCPRGWLPPPWTAEGGRSSGPALFSRRLDGGERNQRKEQQLAARQVRQHLATGGREVRSRCRQELGPAVTARPRRAATDIDRHHHAKPWGHLGERSPSRCSGASRRFRASLV